MTMLEIVPASLVRREESRNTHLRYLLDGFFPTAITFDPKGRLRRASQRASEYKSSASRLPIATENKSIFAYDILSTSNRVLTSAQRTSPLRLEYSVEFRQCVPIVADGSVYLTQTEM
jgi:hypothetical protein